MIPCKAIKLVDEYSTTNNRCIGKFLNLNQFGFNGVFLFTDVPSFSNQTVTSVGFIIIYSNRSSLLIDCCLVEAGSNLEVGFQSILKGLYYAKEKRNRIAIAFIDCTYLLQS